MVRCFLLPLSFLSETSSFLTRKKSLNTLFSITDISVRWFRWWTKIDVIFALDFLLSIVIIIFYGRGHRRSTRRV
jgi:hypothetical protein